MRRLLEDHFLLEHLTTEGKTWARFDAREMAHEIEAVYVEELCQRGIPPRLEHVR